MAFRKTGPRIRGPLRCFRQPFPALQSTTQVEFQASGIQGLQDERRSALFADVPSPGGPSRCGERARVLEGGEQPREVGGAELNQEASASPPVMEETWCFSTNTCFCAVKVLWDVDTLRTIPS